MITKDNLKEVLSSLKEEEVYKAMNSSGDYVAIYVHIFNSGCRSSIESVNYTEELEEEIAGSGNMLIDKDDLLRIYEESGAYNKALQEYI